MCKIKLLHKYYIILLHNKRGLIFTFNVTSLMQFHLQFLGVETNTAVVDVISPINCA